MPCHGLAGRFFRPSLAAFPQASFRRPFTNHRPRSGHNCQTSWCHGHGPAAYLSTATSAVGTSQLTDHQA
ncbi:hypothetical protein TWF106_011723 [Orbilia oligospora]|uniref:Uncharacterized protein n=1 Tax=Orbilia oligospora TaxID=2813651 RepID=A0A6G1MCF6_ORBOL|nr:hypothetical protein TWF788_011646 [Orbilia oligospora]KAF3223157.1 hypothetical protein TWF679_011483 [Orbilia oligospora]KAF3225023.1 hypothetical protein TWF106_011723 [Orbilia oligospora]KAF3226449.1 hypothetical protein TWF191_011420 [Orbilia oligospora]KAF3252624.1 hypothetical protein TWF192_011538 [Orbilia oligospora]